MEERRLTCIGCPMGCPLVVTMDGGEVVRVEGGTIERAAVKTASDIPKGKIFDCMKEIRAVKVAAPVHIGDVIMKDVAGTGVDVVATKNVE